MCRDMNKAPSSELVSLAKSWYLLRLASVTAQKTPQRQKSMVAAERKYHRPDNWLQVTIVRTQERTYIIGKVRLISIQGSTLAPSLRRPHVIAGLQLSSTEKLAYSTSDPLLLPAL